MAQQHINLGTPPGGTDGDTNRTAWAKAEANFNELYGGAMAITVASFKNKIINGSFNVWQRGTALPASSNAAYLADRWKTSGLGSTTVAPSQQAFATGQSVVPGNPKYFHRCVVASVAGATNGALMWQPIENVALLSGQTVTVSFWAKADAAKSIAIEFQQVFGTGGAPSASVGGIGAQLVALTAAWQKFSRTVVIPSITGKALGTANNDCLNFAFWFDAGANFASRAAGLGQQSGTFDIAQVQVEIAGVATDFEFLPPAIELLQCQRYYEKSFPVGVAPAGQLSAQYQSGIAYASTVVQVGLIPFKVQKRAAPSVTLFASNAQPSAGAQKWVIYYSNGIWTVPNSQSAGSSESGLTVELIFSGGLAWGQVAMVSGNWTADAEL